MSAVEVWLLVAVALAVLSSVAWLGVALNPFERVARVAFPLSVAAVAVALWVSVL